MGAIHAARRGGRALRARDVRRAKRVAARLSEPFHVGGETLDLSPRVGVAFAQGDADTAAKLLGRAEKDFEPSG